jgi:hypothetical protein
VSSPRIASLILTSTAALLVLAGRLHADVAVTVIEYRVLRDLGQIRITSTSIHDTATQDSFARQRDRFDRMGLILVAGASSRAVVRHETLGSHVIDTKISIEPAAGRGYRGGLPTAGMTVTVDGQKRIDCPFDERETEFHDVGILVADGQIHLRGSFKDKPFDEFVPLLDARIVDWQWLAAMGARKP